MVGSYQVRLVARNEGIDYVDEHDIYRFGVTFAEKLWRVSLPCSKGEGFRMHELTDEEAHVVLPRIKQYLESRRYFGIIGPTYPVIFERREWLHPRS
jgi:hypothetical protein